MKKNQSHYIQLDLIIMLILLMSISILAIYNAQQLGQYPGQNFVVKQILFYCISISVLAAMQFIDLEQLYKASLYIFIFGAFLVIALHFSPESIAEPKNGAKSWFNNKIPFVSIQPSEFTKIALIVFLSALIVRHKEKFEIATIWTDLWLILKIIIVTIIPTAFIYNQPDLGTSLVFLFIAGVLIILSGVNWKILITLIVGGSAAVALSILLILNLPEFSEEVLGIKPHQIKRVVTWLDPTEQDPNDRYHIELSLLTIGSGQLIGKGMNHSEVNIPEAHTDFIFSIIGESFGFIGGAILILLFFLLLYRLVTLGMKVYPNDPFGAYICFGYMSLILIHTFQNIGMTIGIMPITGIPLLFISYGGSTILSTIIGYALVYKIATEDSLRQEFLFK